MTETGARDRIIREHTRRRRARAEAAEAARSLAPLDEADREKVLDELAAEAQRLGFDY